MAFENVLIPKENLLNKVKRPWIIESLSNLFIPSSETLARMGSMSVLRKMVGRDLERF
jgi:hypothetical protein